MAGLLCGLLVARTLSGAIADKMGWRAPFWLASALMLVMGLVLHAVLPHRAPTLKLSYGQLLGSLWELMRSQPILRSISMISALSFASFCSFWAVLSFFLQSRHHMGSTAAGLFGLVGLAGAMCAPLAGKLSDKRGPGLTLTVALVLSALSFVIMWIDGSILGLIIAVLLLDLGVQSTQVAAQAEVISLKPESRNRLNTVYMVSRFIGGAIGSWAGSLAYARYGWASACLFSIVALSLGLVIQLRAAYR
jgi:predicted MFS family arabinose efflux permease